MPQVVQVIGVYELPAALEVTESCFAESFQTKVGSLDLTITLPYIEWNGDEPRITAPPIDAAIQQQLKPYIESAIRARGGWHYWGHVSGYNSSKRKIMRAHLGAILLEFKCGPTSVTYSDYLYGRGHPESVEIRGLFESIDVWFAQVRTWVEATLDQDADPFHSLLAPTVQGAGLHILTVEGKTISLPVSSFNITATLSAYEPVSLSLLGKIIKLVSAGVTPSDAHLLLRDSRAELRRGRYRRAVIDAGSATEITLADFNNRVTHVTTPPRGATLGWYTNQPMIAAQANLPANITTDLVDIRNNAIHRNRMPTREEAITAIELAKQLVDQLDPLPL